MSDEILHAAVTLRDPEGREHLLGHGDLIGRVWSAALCLTQPGVSEAHAMVSLRGARLELLALRGLFAVDGSPRKQLVLAEGQRIHLTRDVALDVVDVHLPDRILALEAPGLPAQALSGVCGLVLRPLPRLVPRPPDDAAAVFWLAGTDWHARIGRGEAVVVTPGWTADCEGLPLRAVTMELDAASPDNTRHQDAVQQPLRLVSHWDHVLIHREGQPVARVAGMPARLLSEIGEVGTPVHWESLASQLWTDTPERHVQRRRWDATLTRLRKALVEVGVRPDLIRNDGLGHFQLVLEDGDVFEDRG